MGLVVLSAEQRMKPRPIQQRLLASFDALEDHRRRAAAVAALLERCDGEDLSQEVLEQTASLIGEELEAVRDCAARIREDLRR